MKPWVSWNFSSARSSSSCFSLAFRSLRFFSLSAICCCRFSSDFFWAVNLPAISCRGLQIKNWACTTKIKIGTKLVQLSWLPPWKQRGQQFSEGVGDSLGDYHILQPPWWAFYCNTGIYWNYFYLTLPGSSEMSLALANHCPSFCL